MEHPKSDKIQPAMTLQEAYAFCRKIMASGEIAIVALSTGYQRPGHEYEYVAGTPMLLVESLPEPGPQFICRDGNGELVHATLSGQRKIPELAVDEAAVP